MFSGNQFTGEKLPLKHLCLTYDDGPGTNTLEIAQFLAEHNIKATFFVVGKYAIEQEEVLKKLSELGHTIANHTFEHPDLPYYLSKNGDVQNQVLRTHAIIKKYNSNNIMYFRTPYGKWSNEVSEDLNTNILSSINYVGPVYWDIAGIDCYYWKKNISVAETVEKYLADIHEKDHGIIVMHDEIADMDFLKVKNKTLELTKQLIPMLLEEGYKFVGLDEIQPIKDEAAQLPSVTLKTGNGKNIVLSKNNGITIEKQKNTTNADFEILDLSFGKFAFRAKNGFFLSFNPLQENLIEALSREIGDHEKFDIIPIHSNKFLLRAFNGNFITLQSKKSNTLAASAEFMRGGEIFTITPTGLNVKKKFSLNKELKSLKKQFLYIKSKLAQAV